jgi:hypothetical protein
MHQGICAFVFTECDKVGSKDGNTKTNGENVEEEAAVVCRLIPTCSKAVQCSDTCCHLYTFLTYQKQLSEIFEKWKVIL